MNEWKSGKQERAPVSGYLGGVVGWVEKEHCGRWLGKQECQTPKASSVTLRGLDLEGCGKPMENLKQDMICFG